MPTALRVFENRRLDEFQTRSIALLEELVQLQTAQIAKLKDVATNSRTVLEEDTIGSEEAAKFFGLNRDELRRKVREEYMPHYRLGIGPKPEMRFLRSELLEWAAADDKAAWHKEWAARRGKRKGDKR